MLKNKVIYMTIKVLVAIILIITITAILVNVVVIYKTFVNPDKIPDILGYKSFLIVDTKEDGTINKTTAIFTKNIDAKNIKTGDAIVISLNNVVVMQKVKEIKILEDGKYEFTTTGDSNALQNQLIDESKIEGVYIGKSEILGNFIMFIQAPSGMITLVTSLLIVIILTQIYQEKRYAQIRSKQKQLEDLEKELEETTVDKNTK